MIMIKGLTGSGGVIVDSGNLTLPYVSSSSDNFTGLLRISGTDIQYYQNGAWTTLPSSYANIRLDPSTDSLLQWCRTKQIEENSRQSARENMERKAKTHPSLEKAFEAIQRAETARDEEITKAHENFLILEKLIGQEQAGGFLV